MIPDDQVGSLNFSNQDELKLKIRLDLHLNTLSWSDNTVQTIKRYKR